MKGHSGACAYAQTAEGITNRCVYCGKRQRLTAGHMIETRQRATLWEALRAFLAGAQASTHTR